MLHARKDYQRIQDPEGRIPELEPVFLLRGQDIFAPELLLHWAVKLRLSGGQPGMAKMVENHAQKMLVWQQKIKKVPDMPEEEEGIPSSVKFNVPRRNIQTEWVPIEVLLNSAIEMVEVMPADPTLTDAVIKIQEALTLVSDYIERG
jgi:hypothetical protein